MLSLRNQQKNYIVCFLPDYVLQSWLTKLPSYMHMFTRLPLATINITRSLVLCLHLMMRSSLHAAEK